MSAQSPIDPERLRPVLAPTLGHGRTLPGRGLHVAGGLRLGGRALLRGRLGVRRPRRRAGRTRRPEGVPDRRGGHPGRARPGREPPRLLQHVSPPRARAAGAGHHAQPARDQVPVPRVGLPAGRLARAPPLASAIWTGSTRPTTRWSPPASTSGTGGSSSTPTVRRRTFDELRRQPRRAGRGVGARAALRRRPRTST